MRRSNVGSANRVLAALDDIEVADRPRRAAVTLGARPRTLSVTISTSADPRTPVPALSSPLLPRRAAVGRRPRTFAAALGAVVLLVLGGCGSSNSAGSSQPQTVPTGSTTCSYLPSQRPAAKEVSLPPAVEPATGTTPATIALTGGDIVVELSTAATPCTVGSFVHLAQSGYFDNTPCHRLTADPSLSVLQCGDPSGTGGGGPGYTFPDETRPDMKYPAGTLAMANAGPDTNGSQFFLVYQDSTLPPDYTVFGTITSGLDVVQGIAAKGITGSGNATAPVQPVTISAVTVGG